MPHFETITVTANTSGAATAYSAKTYAGTIQLVAYETSATAYLTTVDFTVTTEVSAMDVWKQANVTAAQVVSPVIQCSLASDGSTVSGQYKPILMTGERLKIAIGTAGSGKIGTFRLVVDDPGMAHTIAPPGKDSQ